MSLLRTAARAGVAASVIGNVHRRQQQRWAAQDAMTGQTVTTPEPARSDAAAPRAGDDTQALLDQLARLGELRAAGVLTDAEFEAQKQRILAV